MEKRFCVTPRWLPAVLMMLSLAYLRALPKRNYLLAWFLALLFSATDEFHQSFVPGRNASVIDVLVFDNLGAVAGLFLHYRYFTKRVS